MKNQIPTSKLTSPKHTLGFSYNRMKNRRPPLAVVAAQMVLPPKVVPKKKPTLHGPINAKVVTRKAQKSEKFEKRDKEGATDNND